MRVLLLFSGGTVGDSIRGARRIHMDFIHKLRYHVDFKVYGPGEYGRIADKEICPLKYKSSRTAPMLEHAFNPDVVLVYARGTVKSWLPKNFSKIKAKRVIIEVDYWAEADTVWPWYKNNFDLMIQRGYYRKSCMNAVWLPFSASGEDFIPFQNAEKTGDKVCFIGQSKIGLNNTSTTFYYKFRTRALRKLLSYGSVDNRGTVGHEKYSEVLGSYKYIFTDAAGVRHSPVAKVFEIMASGGLLLCNEIHAWQKLFGKDRPYVCYNDSLRDLVPQALRMLDGQYDNLIPKSKEVVMESHLDRHRIVELVEIMEAVVRERKIPRKWGN